jgi:hypothetical protein
LTVRAPHAQTRRSTRRPDSTLTLSTSSQVWHHTGWKQLASLRKKLESLKELRDLVRSLGRGGGKGPIRRAPQQIFQTVGI